MSNAYEEVIHWIPNLFVPPLRASGKSFVSELARLFQSYGDISSLERVAMKAITVFQHLILQKPSKGSKAKDHVRHLVRRLDLWLDGNLDNLLDEGRCIQERLKRQRPQFSSASSAKSKQFTQHMKKGDVKMALNCLFSGTSKGVLNLDDVIYNGMTV